MTANQTNMTAGTTELHLTVDGDAPAVLDINTGDVASMALLDDGVLQITLKDGNVVHIENFEALADEGVVLELADGSVLNTDALLSALGGRQTADAAPIDALQAEGVLGETALSFGENVIIDQPENGEIALYVYDADNTYTLNIALDQVLDTRAQDEIFLIAFDDGSRILLRGFDGGEQNADQATLLLDGEQLRLQDLLENLRLAMTDRDAPESDLQRSIIEDLDQTDLASVAEQLASIQPAAGETAGGGAGASQGGFGFQSAASDEGFSIPGSSIDGAVGPIGPTSLAFGGDDAEEIENGPITAEGAPAATPAPSITLPPTTLNEDGTLDLTFTADKNAPAAGNIVTTIVISNIPAGWTVNPQGGTYDAVNGTWTTDIPAGTTTFTGGPLLTPPADSDVDANDILVTLTNTDTVSGDSTVTTDTFDIIVDAVADAPTLNAADDTGAEDTALDLDITTAVTDTDGSEDIAAVFVRNVPNGFTLSAGQNNGGGEWQLTPAELAGLQVNAPANYSGTVTLDIVSVSQETPTDQETTTANNSAETQTSVDLTWTPQADAPSITASNASVNEDGTVTVPLAVDLVDTDGSESLTVTISNVPTGWTFNSPGFVAAGAGTYELTLPAGQGFNGDFTLTPPADSDVDLPSLDITATTTEAGNGHTATTSTSISVAVEAVADAPTLTANSAVVDEDGTVAIDVESNLSDTDGSESLTLTVTGVPTGWSFAGAGWAATGNAGEYSITVAAGQNYSDSFTLTPPADSDVDLTGLQITSTATEAANNDQAQTQTTIDVIVDAVADAPTVDAQNASGEEGQAIALDISGTATDTDGSESITGYRIESVDSGFSFNQGTNLGGGVWTFTPAEIVGLEVNAPANYYGSIDLDVYAIASENATDTEPDTADNTAESAVDTVTVTWGAVAKPPVLSINNGSGNPVVDEDGSVSVDIDVTHGANASSTETLSVTVSGIDSSWGFSPAAGTYNAAAGTWTYTVAAGQDIDTALTFTPPADSDVDLSGLQVSATASEPATGTSEDTNGSFDVIVDAVADAPTVDAQNASGEEGTAIALDISGAATDTDGSESITGYRIESVDSGFSFNQGTNLGGGVWTFTPAEIVGLEVNAPANYYGSIDLDVYAIASENATDTEPDTADNTAESAVDTVTVTWGAVAKPPVLSINNGSGNPVVDEDGSVSVDIDVTHGANASSTETLSVTVSGIDSSWGFSPAAGTYNAAAGTWTYTVAAGQDIDTALTFTPPADSDVDLSGLQVSATASEPATGTSEDTNGSFDVIVDAVADAPTVDAQNASGEEGTAIALDISASLNDLDGSEAIDTIILSNLPTGATLSAGTYHAGTDTWSLSKTQLSGLEINVPGGTVGTFNLGVTAVAQEQNTSDIEPDTSDNTASTSTTLTLTVTADDVPVQNSPATAAVDEDALTGGSSTSDTGSVDFDFGADTAGSYDVTNSFTAGGSLSGGSLQSGGRPVVVTQSGNGYVGKVGATTIFTLTLNSTTGAYNFTLFEPLDHAAAGTDDILLNFGYEAKDNEGDATSATLTVTVQDDTPAYNNVSGNVDEDSFGATLSTTVALSGVTGADGAGNVSPSGSFSATAGGSTTPLTVDGQAVTVTQSGNDYVGRVGGTVIFTLVYNSANGTFAYTQNQPIDHPNTGNDNDVLTLNFGMNAEDGDGDASDFTVAIDVRDSGPVAVNDTDSVIAEDRVTNGNVLTNDDAGADGGAEVTNIAYFGNNQSVPSSGSATVSGSYGSLSMNENGTYDYTLYTQNTDYVDTNTTYTDTFTYRMEDRDGDSDTATLTITTDAARVRDGSNGNSNLSGGNSGDVLMGDQGGLTTTQPSKNYNLNIILDTSGSVHGHLPLAIDAVENLLQSISSYNAGDIRINIETFAANAGASGTFTITNGSGLTNAMNFLDSLSPYGPTNYEAGLEAGIDWLQNGNQLSNSETYSLFVSDGNSNAAYDSSGNIFYAYNTIGEATGSDGSDEAGTLASLNEVIGVMIGTDTNESNMNQIDSDGDLIAVEDSGDLGKFDSLEDLFGALPTQDIPADVGNDVIQGGGGDDIIFGDVVNTDALADAEGLSTAEGVGFDVFDVLVGSHGWDIDDVGDYIHDNHASLAAESQINGETRGGGDDVLNGGSGDDIIYGQEGDDVITGGTGNDTLSGGSGADRFVYEAVGNGHDTVTDFDQGEGDRVDLSDLLTGYNPVQDSINDFVFVRNSGGNTVVSVDVNGGGNASQATDIMTLEGSVNNNVGDIIVV